MLSRRVSYRKSAVLILQNIHQKQQYDANNYFSMEINFNVYYIHLNVYYVIQGVPVSQLLSRLVSAQSVNK